MIGEQCWTLDGNKSTGWMTYHTPSTRQLDNEEGILKGKQDSWLGNGEGKLELAAR